MMNYKFSVGDQVIFTNDFGVCWGAKTIIGLDERSGLPTYHYEGSDTPWFSVHEKNLTLAYIADRDLADIDENWAFYQTKYGWKPTVEQMGGCY
jgi:hypothetical protein